MSEPMPTHVWHTIEWT